MGNLFIRLLASEPLDDDALWADWQAVVEAAASTGGEDLVPLVGRVRDERSQRVFGAQMREAWNLVPPGDRTVASWTMLNAFAARLTAAGTDFSLFGLWSIGTALETFAEVPTHLPAAVQWFKFCGPALVSATLHHRTYAGRSGRLHDLAERDGLTEGGYNVPRWMFWRSRLEGLAESGDPVAREGLRYACRFDRQIAG